MNQSHSYLPMFSTAISDQTYRQLQQDFVWTSSAQLLKRSSCFSQIGTTLWRDAIMLQTQIEKWSYTALQWLFMSTTAFLGERAVVVILLSKCVATVYFEGTWTGDINLKTWYVYTHRCEQHGTTQRISSKQQFVHKYTPYMQWKVAIIYNLPALCIHSLSPFV